MWPTIHIVIIIIIKANEGLMSLMSSVGAVAVRRLVRWECEGLYVIINHYKVVIYTIETELIEYRG